VTGASADAMIGRLIDGRYQINSRIARGGMATVYVATDLRLERRVAVKIMHGHLADDEAFRTRFIQEARSAARLAHPNVVSVFDQGQDSEMAYLVMEYLPGITLRDLLKDYGKLTPEQTLDIMDAVLRGLAAAHEAGIVHRDLKPENVLLADDGRIKIGDFGLARATTANTASGQALLGTIAYLSPELLTRGVADARSDIYAAGIMMFEMLTGEQPFKGEQPMQVAYQHANDKVPAPSSKNPKVPSALDDIVAWSTQRAPENRPENAQQLLDALLVAEGGIRLDTHTSNISTQQTIVMPAHGFGSDDETRVIGQGATSAISNPTGRLSLLSQPRRKRGLVLIAVVLLLALLGGGAGWYFSAGPGSFVAIPKVSGQTPAAATAVLKAAGFGVTEQQVNSAEVPQGQTIGTLPQAGSKVARGAKLTLQVSLGPKMINVPVLAGLPQAQAETTLKTAGFVLNKVVQKFDAKVPAGTVISASDGAGAPLPATYPEGGQIILTVSAGAVPDVVGKPQADAIAALTAAGLKPTLAPQAYSMTVPNGSVISVDIPKTGLAPGDTVTVTVSKGPEMVDVPNFLGGGWVISEAIAKLKALGFNVSTNIAPALQKYVPVTSQNPAAGPAPKGSTVTVNGPS
jgi:beta-lactam-binding protein with PASTA domain/tRNA A-37 threonylcarbamoyl transferase component Bud32